MATSLMDKAQSFADANKVEPLTNEFDESKGVAGRVAQITDQNSPLMQRAAVQGTNLAAARGLTNSSLAAESSQNAVLGAATPIATADAQMYSTNSLANLAAKNQAAIANGGNATALGNTALSGEAQGEQLDKSLANSNAQQDKTLAQQAQQFGVQAGQAQQQIDSQISQFAQSLGMTAQDLQIKRDTLTQQQQQYLAGLESQKSIAQLQANTSLTTAGISADTQKAVAAMSQQTQMAVAKLQADNASSIQGNQSMGASWASFMTNIANIQNNPNLEQGAKATLIQNNIDSFKAYATFWNKTTGIDVGDLLNFNMANATAPTIPGTPGGPPATPAGPVYGAPNQGGGAGPGYPGYFDSPGGAGGGG